MMKAVQEQYIVDSEGHRQGVILDLASYRQLLEEAEEFEVIKAYDMAKSSKDEAIPFDRAILEIQKNRK
jgi:hypothetical protein